MVLDNLDQSLFLDFLKLFLDVAGRFALRALLSQDSLHLLRHDLGLVDASQVLQVLVADLGLLDLKRGCVVGLLLRELCWYLLDGGSGLALLLGCCGILRTLVRV